MNPLAIDLFCGLGGWTRGFLAEGYRCVGFDIEEHCYGDKRYPADLVLQDVLTLHGSQFRDAACIVASPPCQKYSYMAQPWDPAKREGRWQRWERESPFGDFRLNDLFNACFRIQREASAAAGHHVPLVVENVKGAQPWVGRAAWHYGSYYLWGDVPALMPSSRSAVKVPGISWSGYGKPGYNPKGFNVTATQRYQEGVKQAGLSGPAWFDHGIAHHSSRSPGRKAASAMIAEIPFDLAQWIARCYLPHASESLCGMPALISNLTAAEG